MRDEGNCFRRSLRNRREGEVEIKGNMAGREEVELYIVVWII